MVPIRDSGWTSSCHSSRAARTACVDIHARWGMAPSRPARRIAKINCALSWRLVDHNERLWFSISLPICTPDWQRRYRHLARCDSDGLPWVTHRGRGDDDANHLGDHCGRNRGVCCQMDFAVAKQPARLRSDNSPGHHRKRCGDISRPRNPPLWPRSSSRRTPAMPPGHHWLAPLLGAIERVSVFCVSDGGSRAWLIGCC